MCPTGYYQIGYDLVGIIIIIIRKSLPEPYHQFPSQTALVIAGSPVAPNWSKKPSSGRDRVHDLFQKRRFQSSFLFKQRHFMSLFSSFLMILSLAGEPFSHFSHSSYFFPSGFAFSLT